VIAATVARRDVVAQYEAVATGAGLHAGIVDLASFNVMNAVIGAGAAPAADWLLVTLAARGDDAGDRAW
jgi:Tfp pilus assembly PilM family ATPase